MRRWLALALVAVLAAAGAVGVISSSGSKPQVAQQPTVTLPPVRLPPGAPVLTVGAAAGERPIPAGFLGLSLEFPALRGYAGRDPDAVNPVFEQLIRNLAPGQAPVLRIGGDSTDWTWWPVPGMRRPPGVKYTLREPWIRVARALTHALAARVILGINLEAGSPTVAAAEARALLAGIGAGSVEAFELGNEPELYATFPWYRAPDGRLVPGRPPGYGFRAFTRDFSRVGGAVPDAPLAGPTTGFISWMRHLPRFASAEPRLGLVTVHRYPLQLCFVTSTSPFYPTIGHLLSQGSSTALADGIERYVGISHAYGLPLRLDEMNSVSCGGAPGVSDTFASALWGLDTLFEMARVGVDGVNIHTFPAAIYGLFHFRLVNGAWRGSVEPEYYGLLMFAQAAPPGSQLLRLSGRSGSRIQAWATRARDGRIRVVLINDAAGPRALAVRVPAAAGAATLERLEAPSVRAKRGVTLGGESFGPETGTGVLPSSPRTLAITPVAGEYSLRLPAASAAMLTFRTS